MGSGAAWDVSIDQINQIVWACGVSDSSRPWIAKSKDKGDDWETTFLDLSPNNTTCYQIVLHPQSPDTMYLGTNNSVLKSIDGGKNWHITLQQTSTLFINLAIDLFNPRHIYAGGYFYLWESYDGGETWQQIAGRGIIKKLLTVPENPNALYMATQNGVWRYESVPKLVSDDAIILTLEMQESIKLDTALALEIDEALNAARARYDTLKSVHTHPYYVPTQLLLTSTASWTQAWRQYKIITGNPAIDSLSTIYKLIFAEYKNDDYFVLNFAEPLKIPLLAQLYQIIPGVIYATPNSYGIIEAVDWIIVFKKTEIWHIVFIDALQGGPIGSPSVYFYVAVDNNLVAELIAKQKYGYESVPKIYLWNIPAIYCATVFKNGDELFSSALSSPDWWVRRHAVEVMGRLYAYNNPRELADKNNSSLYYQLRDEMRSRQQKTIAVLMQLLNDPDLDVQTSAQWSLEKVLNFHPTKLDYFPMQVNNRWTFSDVISEHIQNSVIVTDSLYFRFDQFRNSLKDVLLRMTSTNKLLMRSDSTEQVWLDFSANIGDSWKVIAPGGGAEWNVHLQSKTDTVTVPASTFTNCYRFWFQFAGADNDWVEWYAPGVGPVKRILYGFAVIEYPLTSSWVNGVYYPTKVTAPPSQQIPETFYLYPNYPNPFNSSTVIRYDLPALNFVALEIYNLLGQKVRTLLNSVQSPGQHQILWEGRDDGGNLLPTGIYLYHLRAGKRTSVQKIALIK